MLQVWVFSSAWTCGSLVPPYPRFQDKPIPLERWKSKQVVISQLILEFLSCPGKWQITPEPSWSCTDVPARTLLITWEARYTFQYHFFCNFIKTSKGELKKKCLKFLVCCACIGTQMSLVRIQSFRRNTLPCQEFIFHMHNHFAFHWPHTVTETWILAWEWQCWFVLQLLNENTAEKLWNTRDLTSAWGHGRVSKATVPLTSPSEMLEHGQRRAVELGKGLEVRSCEECLRELGVFIQRRGSSRGILSLSTTPWKVSVARQGFVSPSNWQATE